MNPKNRNPESDLRPERNDRSPLDVPAVPTNITKDEINSTIREIRGRGWEKDFRVMALNQDDKLMDVNSLKIQNQWDKDEWTW
jgi:hypothetical protein